MCEYSILGRIHKNGVIKIIYQQAEQNENISSDEEDYNDKNSIRDAVWNHQAIAVYDVSVGDKAIVGFWQITNNHNDKLASDYIAIKN